MEYYTGRVGKNRMHLVKIYNDGSGVLACRSIPYEKTASFETGYDEFPEMYPFTWTITYYDKNFDTISCKFCRKIAKELGLI